jgi:DNA-binding beta-propeller fold protein YncE
MKRRLYGEDADRFAASCASSLSNLASVLRAKDDLAESAALHRESLEMRRRLHGETGDHRDVAASLSSLANALAAQGDLVESARLLRESLKMRRRLHGDGVDHLDVAESLNNLAIVLKTRGKLDKSVRLHGESLAMRRRLHGDGVDHLDVATSLGNLANVLCMTGDLDESVRLHRESLAMRRRLHGDGVDHLDVATSLGNLAFVLKERDELDESVRLERESSEMQRRLGVNAVSGAQRDVAESYHRYHETLVNHMPISRGEKSRIIKTARVKSVSNGVAVSRNGATLLVTDAGGGSHAIHEFSVADGSRLRVIGANGDGPLQFKNPRQVWVASDDYVFVADSGNNRVQVLTPRLDFHAFVGVGQLSDPAGVCANDGVVVVSEHDARRISVFNRGDGALLRRFGSDGSGDGQLDLPYGLCFAAGERHVAVADSENNRVSVFSVDGEFIRHVGVGKLLTPQGVACSAVDELVVADSGGRRVAVFSASGERLLRTMGGGGFAGVAIHGSVMFAHYYENCVVFE